MIPLHLMFEATATQAVRGSQHHSPAALISPLVYTADEFNAGTSTFISLRVEEHTAPPATGTSTEHDAFVLRTTPSPSHERALLPPAILANATPEVLHTDLGRGRAARLKRRRSGEPA